jgi:RNA polymerase sigma factor (sigma-70 family)
MAGPGLRNPAGRLRQATSSVTHCYADFDESLQQPAQSQDESGPERAGDIDPSGFTEQRQWVLDLLRTLPPEQRKVVALLTDGATCPEIAALTGKSPETVRSLLRHARKTLKELMELGES